MENEWIQMGINVFLLLLTLGSTYYAKKAVQVAKEQLKLISNPVIGIEVNNIDISKVYAGKYRRRNMRAEVEITNIGGDPAIEVLIDGEIELEYSNIKGETIIPARFPPSQKSFLISGDKVSGNEIVLDFGNVFVEHFFESSKVMCELNQQRIRNTPWKDAYQTAKLIVYVYYSNNVGQYFKSQYVIYIYLEGKIPNKNEEGKVGKVYIPRPIFSNTVISKRSMESEIEARDKKRCLCGW